MDIQKYRDFIKSSDFDDLKEEKEDRLQTIEDLYNPGLHSPGTLGIWQLMDRVQFMIALFHNQVGLHPSMHNPDKDFDKVRDQVAVLAQDMFILFSLVMEQQSKRDSLVN